LIQTYMVRFIGGSSDIDVRVKGSFSPDTTGPWRRERGLEMMLTPF
jgi:hypothetical protein